MILFTAPLCCLFLLGVVCLTTASPALVDRDGDLLHQAMVSAKISNQQTDDMIQATIQHNCCRECRCLGVVEISALSSYDLDCSYVLCRYCTCEWIIRQ